jgi:hypothetical protein
VCRWAVPPEWLQWPPLRSLLNRVSVCHHNRLRTNLAVSEEPIDASLLYASRCLKHTRHLFDPAACIVSGIEW